MHGTVPLRVLGLQLDDRPGPPLVVLPRQSALPGLGRPLRRQVKVLAAPSGELGASVSVALGPADLREQGGDVCHTGRNPGAAPGAARPSPGSARR